MFTRKVNTTAVPFGFLCPSNEFLSYLARENGNIAYCKSHNAFSPKRHAYYNKNRRARFDVARRLRNNFLAERQFLYVTTPLPLRMTPITE